MSRRGLQRLGRLTLLSLVLLGGFLSACRSTPSLPPNDFESLVSQMAMYAAWLRVQSEEALQQEFQRLDLAEPSPDRSLQLALLLGDRNSTLHDPRRASELLGQLTLEDPAGSSHAQLASILIAVLPQPDAQDAGQAARVEQLAEALQQEEQRQRDLKLRLQNLEQQLEAERAQRARLEGQLGALKSLEEQIKSRDGARPPR